MPKALLLSFEEDKRTSSLTAFDACLQRTYLCPFSFFACWVSFTREPPGQLTQSSVIAWNPHLILVHQSWNLARHSRETCLVTYPRRLNSEIHHLSASRVNNGRACQLPAAALRLPNPQTSSTYSPVADEHLQYSLKRSTPSLPRLNHPRAPPCFSFTGND